MLFTDLFVFIITKKKKKKKTKFNLKITNFQNKLLCQLQAWKCQNSLEFCVKNFLCLE